MRVRGVPGTTSRIASVSRTAHYAIAHVITLGRARGALLRLARRRSAALIVGLALAGPAAYQQLTARYDAWWVDGLSLIAAATGAALIWTAISGTRGDWVDPG